VDRVVVIAAGGGVTAERETRAPFPGQAAGPAGRGGWGGGGGPLPRAAAAHHAPTQILAEGTRLAFRYPGATAWALEGADIDVGAGEALALTGPNGSGKSTLALLIAGLLRPARGVARLGLDDAWRLPARALVTEGGTVFQDPEHQFVATRVDDELTIGPRRAGRGETEARAIAAELLERL